VPVPILGEREREIDGGRRLSLFGHRARDEQDLPRRPVGSRLVELQAQATVSLRDGRPRLVREHQMRVVGELPWDDPSQGHPRDERDALVFRLL
jgi:hypothetical protein